MDLNKNESVPQEEKVSSNIDNPNVDSKSAPVAAASAASRNVLNDVSESIKTIDGRLIMRLLKNPLESLSLNPNKDLVYGILGIVASVVGFLIWSFIIGAKLQNLFNSIFGFGGFGGLMDSGRISTAIVGKMFLMSLFSIISLFVGLSAIGIWKGSQRHSFNTIIIKLGGAQYMAGAGFLIAAVLALLSIKLSLFVLIITLLSTLILTVTASIELFEVTRERRTLYIVSSIASYSLLLMLLGSITI